MRSDYRHPQRRTVREILRARQPPAYLPSARRGHQINLITRMVGVRLPANVARSNPQRKHNLLIFFRRKGSALRLAWQTQNFVRHIVTSLGILPTDQSTETLPAWSYPSGLEDPDDHRTACASISRKSHGSRILTYGKANQIREDPCNPWLDSSFFSVLLYFGCCVVRRYGLIVL